MSYPNIYVQKPKKKKRSNHESKLQQQCVKWFRLQFRDVMIFSIPNGGSRHQKEVAKIKAEGVVAGVSDLFIMKASRGFHGLFIEMKYGKNTTTEKQDVFLAKARSERYATAVCYSFEEFVKVTTQYLK
ncbi:VRR-NUC domain-containing protein [Weeksella virosa]|uniref:VRR-NUC domain-containing protein n=1 Tax=Weeksella virosa TaxID=1014 RepID=UPI003D743FCF